MDYPVLVLMECHAPVTDNFFILLGGVQGGNMWLTADRAAAQVGGAGGCSHLRKRELSGVWLCPRIFPNS